MTDQIYPYHILEHHSLTTTTSEQHTHSREKIKKTTCRYLICRKEREDHECTLSAGYFCCMLFTRRRGGAQHPPPSSVGTTPGAAPPPPTRSSRDTLELHDRPPTPSFISPLHVVIPLFFTSYPGKKKKRQYSTRTHSRSQLLLGSFCSIQKNKQINK